MRTIQSILEEVAEKRHTTPEKILKAFSKQLQELYTEDTPQGKYVREFFPSPTGVPPTAEEFLTWFIEAQSKKYFQALKSGLAERDEQYEAFLDSVNFNFVKKEPESDKRKEKPSVEFSFLSDSSEYKS